jgi:hypothetical protein
MPIIVYSCECKNTVKKFVRSVRNLPASLPCHKCGKELTRTLSAPSNLSKVTVDNGFQARSVEIVPNIIEIMEERSQLNLKEKE